MESARNVILVGMMGAGKTTVGRALARRLQRQFVDCDHELEARTGVRVPTIFEIEGEAGFRRRESQLLAELLAGTGLVLATGGGVVTDPENRRCLAQHGLVVYLRVPPQHLWERLRHDRSRPLLQVPDPRGRIEELFRQRDPLYLEVADLVIEGGCTSAVAVARQIEKEVSTRCAA